METNNILNQYDNVKDDLKLLTTSNVRSKIILSLNNGNKQLSSLRNELKLGSSTILRAMEKLKTHNILIKKDREYSLSPYGKLYAFKLEKMLKSYYAIKNNDILWLEHHINGIPEYLLKDIGCLCDSIIIKGTPTDVVRPYTYFAELFNESQEIKCISPIFYNQYVFLYKKVLKKGSTLELMLTPMILDKLIETIGIDELKKLILSNGLKIGVIDEDTNIIFTVTEKFISIGLFSNEGQFDGTMKLFSFSPDAIKWGNKLYEYYLKKAQLIDLDYFKEL
ncbi:helix-turn-helix transcriptional regulator [Methanobacterium oryzae]|uniref:helix-turn-helix transcriptional regulator n=1 Tax=Methanobacterium oryzae TaxID=69540 RepID=UPI003D1E55FF